MVLLYRFDSYLLIYYTRTTQNNTKHAMLLNISEHLVPGSNDAEFRQSQKSTTEGVNFNVFRSEVEIAIWR